MTSKILKRISMNITLLFLLPSVSSGDIPQSKKRKFPVPEVFQNYILQSNTNASIKAFSRSSFLSASFSNQYLLKELLEKTLSCIWVRKGNAAGIGMQHFGYQKYGEFVVSAFYSRLFAGRITSALQVHYMLNHAYQYAANHSLTFDLSFFVKISDKVGIGADIYNPARLKYGFTGSHYIPLILRIISVYKMQPTLLLHVSVEKTIPGPLIITFGIDYSFRMMVLGFSFSNKSAVLSGSVHLDRFVLQFVSEYCYKLGYSPKFSFSYFF